MRLAFFSFRHTLARTPGLDQTQTDRSQRRHRQNDDKHVFDIIQPPGMRASDVAHLLADASDEKRRGESPHPSPIHRMLKSLALVATAGRRPVLERTPSSGPRR